MERRVRHAQRGDIARTESIALTNLSVRRRGRRLWNDGVLAVLGEGIAGVMHDGAVVVATEIGPVLDVLVELADPVWPDIRRDNRDELVAILTALFMPEPNGVADLVDR